jgi:hypothetical protein
MPQQQPQQPQQPHGQYQNPPSQWQASSPPPKKNNTPILLTLVVALIAVALVAILVFVMDTGDDANGGAPSVAVSPTYTPQDSTLAPIPSPSPTPAQEATPAPDGRSQLELDLVGSWECRDDSQPHEWMCNFTFNSQGRFIDRDGDLGYWEIVGGDLVLDFDQWETLRFNVSISMNLLTLSDDHGNFMILHRADSDDVNLG